MYYTKFRYKARFFFVSWRLYTQKIQLHISITHCTDNNLCVCNVQVQSLFHRPVAIAIPQAIRCQRLFGTCIQHAFFQCWYLFITQTLCYNQVPTTGTKKFWCWHWNIFRPPEPMSQVPNRCQHPTYITHAKSVPTVILIDMPNQCQDQKF